MAIRPVLRVAGIEGFQCIHIFKIVVGLFLSCILRMCIVYIHVYLRLLSICLLTPSKITLLSLNHLFKMFILNAYGEIPALSVFYQLFYYLEKCGILDPLSQTDLYCLHYPYIPRINNALNSFKHGSSYHRELHDASTIICLLFHQTSNNCSCSDIHLPLPDLDSAGVIVSEIKSPLSPSQEEELHCRRVQNYEIELYVHAKDFLHVALAMD